MVTIRPRSEGDLGSCAALLRAVHEADRYPLHLPDDPESFVVEPDAFGAWVALAGGDIVGHVLLRPAGNPKMMALASVTTGLPETRLAAVGRLFVAPSSRRLAVGRALLARAASEAHALGRRPVLDVVATGAAAIALYRREGWSEAGVVEVTFRSGETVSEFVFVGPADQRARSCR